MGKNKNGVYYGRLGKLSAENGYVIYKRIKDDNSINNIWANKIYGGFENIFNSDKNILYNNSWEAVANVLEQVGKAEYAKEIRMLKEIFGANVESEITWKDYPQYINTINELIGMKDKYKDYLRELEEQSKDTHNRRAAGGFRYFESRLTTTINQNIREILSKFNEEQLLSMTADDFTQIIQSILEKSIEDAVYKVADSDSGYIGKVKLWTEIRNGFEKLNTINKNNFINEVISRYDLTSVSKKVGQQLQEYFSVNSKEKKKKLTLSKMIKTNMNINELKGASIEGFLSEFLTSLLTPSNKGTGLVFKNNVFKTDSIRYLSIKGEAGIPQDIIEEADNLFSQDLKEAQEKMDAFTREVLDKVQDGFVVYESSKMYRLSGSFNKRGFHGSSGNLSNLGNILQQYGNGPSQLLTLNIANLIYQTIPGAILSDNGTRKKNIINSVKRIIIENIAAALFDDVQFQGINNSDERVIHMLNLDNVQIPLSYYCQCIAEAIRDSIESGTGKIVISSYVQVNITTPKSILFPNKINSDDNSRVYDENGNQLDFPESVFVAWEQQREDAERNSSFSINFLRNFNDILKELQDSLKI